MKGAIRCLLPTALAVAVIATAGGAILAAPAGAAPLTSPDGLWTWSRPLPFGYPASSIAAPAPGELFVATKVSDLLATTDGGTSWTWSRTGAVPGFAEPQGVQFVSATEGWAWGVDTTLLNGMLLHTTDGGASWQSSFTAPSQVGPRMVRFAGPLSGWVVSGDYEDFVLDTTSDGGQTWSGPLAVPNGDGDSFETLAPQGAGKAVVFEAVYEAGWANGDFVGTRVERTTDGGATWLAPTMLKGVEFVDAAFSSSTKGWATDDNAGCWLWRTTNGGASWHKAHRAMLGAHILTVGDDVWVVSAGSSGSLHSSDGGRTWQTLPRLSASCISFSDPSNGWIADGAGYRRTTDGGKTWQRITPASQETVGSLAAVGDETVWGVSGRVIKTTDGGQHWRSASKRQVAALAAVSALRAWAVGGRGLIIHTTDGGHHWARQPSGVTVGLSDVFFLDARHGWASGGNKLLRTIDGGRRWTHTHVAVPADISELDFADARHGIAIDSSRGILITGNGGRTWSKTRLPVSKYLPTAAIMQDASDALIVAWSQLGPAAAWTTSDGGETWQLGGDLPNDDRYVGIARSGSLLCAVGGGVPTSRDGGATWSAGGAPPGVAMTSAQFVDTDTLMVAGFYGVMTRNLTTAPLP